MLKKVKSSYIKQSIFLFVSEKIKLKLIKNNKKEQKFFNINLNNYQLFKRNYIIGDKNGKAKEYDLFNDKLLFDGEYLNGIKNGKGKEYEKGHLIYEGEYLNGERHGKRKEYDITGVFLFEGEYLNGKKWDGIYKIYKLKNGKGFIREYYNDKVVFKGEYLNGLRHGKGKEYDCGEKLIFDGEYLNGKNGMVKDMI